MKRFIEALNSINPQVWAFSILLIGLRFGARLSSQWHQDRHRRPGLIDR